MTNSKRIVLYLFGILTTCCVHAYDFEVNGIYYNYINDGRELAVTRRWGPFSNYQGSINIPESVTYKDRTRPVTTIKSEAFSGANLQSLTIPKSIVKIEDKAFSCNVEKLFIEDLKSWIERDFESPSGLQVNHLYNNNEEIKDLKIPDNITKIGDYAFSNFYGIKTVSIPSSVKSIGKYAFDYCTGITSINISEGVTTIGVRAFQYCKNMHSITIPSTVETIENGAFSNCYYLQKLTLPDGVRSIEDWAFASCYCLFSINIPKSVIKIGVAPFYNCNLSTIKVDADNVYFDSRDNCNAIIRTESNTLIQGAKYGFIHCMYLNGYKQPGISNTNYV